MNTHTTKENLNNTGNKDSLKKSERQDNINDNALTTKQNNNTKDNIIYNITNENKQIVINNLEKIEQVHVELINDDASIIRPAKLCDINNIKEIKNILLKGKIQIPSCITNIDNIITQIDTNNIYEQKEILINYVNEIKLTIKCVILCSKILFLCTDNTCKNIVYPQLLYEQDELLKELNKDKIDIIDENDIISRSINETNKKYEKQYSKLKKYFNKIKRLKTLEGIDIYKENNKKIQFMKLKKQYSKIPFNHKYVYSQLAIAENVHNERLQVLNEINKNKFDMNYYTEEICFNKLIKKYYNKDISTNSKLYYKYICDNKPELLNNLTFKAKRHNLTVDYLNNVKNIDEYLNKLIYGYNIYATALINLNLYGETKLVTQKDNNNTNNQNILQNMDIEEDIDLLDNEKQDNSNNMPINKNIELDDELDLFDLMYFKKFNSITDEFYMKYKDKFYNKNENINITDDETEATSLNLLNNNPEIISKNNNNKNPFNKNKANQYKNNINNLMKNNENTAQIVQVNNFVNNNINIDINERQITNINNYNSNNNQNNRFNLPNNLQFIYGKKFNK